jgi:hypothetical protein
VRMTEARYARDRARHDLAYKLLALGARNHTVIQWTGLTEYQVRALGNTYTPPATRLRGPAPSHIEWFWQGPHRRQQAAVLAAICYRSQFIHQQQSKHRRDFANLERGASLCRVYRFYVSIFSKPELPLEYALMLLWELNRRELIRLGRCSRCPSLVLVDRLSKGASDCCYCSGQLKAVEREAAASSSSEPVPLAVRPRVVRRRAYREIKIQEKLF